MIGRKSRGRRVVVILVIGTLGVAGAAVAAYPRPASIAPAPAATVERENVRAPQSAARKARVQMAVPVRISIPAIGVNARVIPLGLNRDRTIEVPKNFAEAGWFRPGPEPGEQGAAVIVGHLASRSGPGVFIRLRMLRPGQVITIHLADRSRVRFVARSSLRVPKSRFPTKRVYAQTQQPTLRLVTCAGTLNPRTGRHPDNYIVFAALRD
jgi:sortase (surface protein transpeptidase)